MNESINNLNNLHCKFWEERTILPSHKALTKFLGHNYLQTIRLVKDGGRHLIGKIPAL